MTWKEIKDTAWFVFIWVLAINLIEYQADTLIAETAGDFFGAIALVLLGAERALREDDPLTN